MTHLIIRSIGGLVLAAVLLMTSWVPLLACDITIKPDRITDSIGATISLEITIKLTHRNCPVPMADTKFVTTSNLKVTAQTPWVSAGKDTYKTVLSVQLLAAGLGKLEVIRDCIKEGGYADITLTVGGGGTAITESLSPTSQPPTATTAVIAKELEKTSDDENEEITWAEAFKRALSQPFVWAYLGLTAFAYIGLLQRRRHQRYISLAFSMVYLGFFLGLCPCVIGAIQNVILHLGDAKTYLAHFIILSIPIISTVFLGRLFCGWICPMGAVQQFLYRRDLSLKPPAWVGKKLPRLRFIVLAAIIFAALYTGTAAFAEIDPFNSLFNAQIAPVPTTLLVIILGASIFVFTPWCRFLCPMGAVLSVVGRVSRRQLVFKAECKNCNACARSFCDYQAISPGSTLPVIEQNECARCGECISRCPRKSMDYTLPERQVVQPAGSIRPTPSDPIPMPETA